MIACVRRDRSLHLCAASAAASELASGRSGGAYFRSFSVPISAVYRSVSLLFR